MTDGPCNTEMFGYEAQGGPRLGLRSAPPEGGHRPFRRIPTGNLPELVQVCDGEGFGPSSRVLKSRDTDGLLAPFVASVERSDRRKKLMETVF